MTEDDLPKYLEDAKRAALMYLRKLPAEDVMRVANEALEAMPLGDLINDGETLLLGSDAEQALITINGKLDLIGAALSDIVSVLTAMRAGNAVHAYPAHDPAQGAWDLSKYKYPTSK